MEKENVTKVSNVKCTVEISEKTLMDLIRQVNAYKENYMDRKEFNPLINAYADNSNVEFLINVDVDGTQDPGDYYLALPEIYNED